jgi:hypothetical protein
VIIYIIDIKNITFTIPENNPVVWADLNPTFIGFSRSDLDTLILRRYKPNDNYLSLIDTLIIANQAWNNGLGVGVYSISNDTTVVFVDSAPPSSGPIRLGYSI